MLSNSSIRSSWQRLFLITSESTSSQDMTSNRCPLLHHFFFFSNTSHGACSIVVLQRKCSQHAPAFQQNQWAWRTPQLHAPTWGYCNHGTCPTTKWSLFKPKDRYPWDTCRTSFYPLLESARITQP
ncbi:hypothetical protein CEXT_463811 [Caerostris extrusa]|uniref:Uncharacterized protein n=1 Tax=Caerostris extrusa TaxID=172846 RepID=A0AAV4NS99_CAEEX|nr:hypothetical protein CEXT_463811 [Caerostris extrusa]